MPRDTDQVAALLNERAAVAGRRDAKRRIGEIDAALAGLGYDGPLAGDVETTDPPKRRGRPPKIVNEE